jgi:hypothetical protein
MVWPNTASITWLLLLMEASLSLRRLGQYFGIAKAFCPILNNLAVDKAHA